jgi:hypothetical protein
MDLPKVSILPQIIQRRDSRKSCQFRSSSHAQLSLNFKLETLQEFQRDFSIDPFSRRYVRIANRTIPALKTVSKS